MNFKKLVSFSSSIALAASCAFSAGSVCSAADKENLLVLGDSIASGYNADLKFGDIIADYKGDEIDSYKNLAVPGISTTELLDNYIRSEQYASDIKNADTIIISAGGNDYLDEAKTALSDYIDSNDTMEDVIAKLKANENEILAKFSSMPDVTGSAIANLQTTANEIKELNPDAEIYVLSIYTPFEGFETDNTKVKLAMSMVGTMIETFNTKLSIMENVKVIDAASAFAGNMSTYVNTANKDIHPTNAGQIKIASTFLKQETGKDEKQILGKVFSALPYDIVNSLPSVLTDGVVTETTETTVTSITEETVSSSETTAASEETVEETTVTSESDSVSSTTTSASETSVSSTSTTKVSTTSTTKSTTISSSPATSDHGFGAVAVTAVASIAAALAVSVRKKK